MKTRATTAQAPTNLRPPLAGSARLTPEDLRVEEETRSLWQGLTADKALLARLTRGPIRWLIYRLCRANDRFDPVAATARLIIACFNAGFSEALLRRIPQYLDRIIDDCFVGNATRSLDALDVEEHELESGENGLALARRIGDGATPELLEREAELNEAESAVQRERARTLRRQARALRRESPVAVRS